MSSAARRILLGVVAIAAVVMAAGVWTLPGPGPTAFSGGDKVALADYKATDPTGVPASIAKTPNLKTGATDFPFSQFSASRTIPPPAAIPWITQQAPR